MLTVRTQKGGKREGAGRPIVGATKKSINMSFRISPEEKALIDEKARLAGKTTSQFIIETVLNS